MGREIRLNIQSIETLACSVCGEYSTEPWECYACEKFFCFNCLTDFANSNPIGNCPQGCVNTRIEVVGPTFSKMLRQLIVKCKYNNCNAEVPLQDILTHEETCRCRPDKMDIDKHDRIEEIRLKRDSEWIQMLQNSWGRGYPLVYPMTPNGCMPFFAPNYPPPMTPTPSSHGSFVFPCPTPRSNNFQL
ncbi:unnamed protein product [Blepharisma stoltei]|uniref:RING-type domain-containing protein n=1 Tax=Blepharisma stoltei TaxID=1481888 RepID=A0AAU9JLW9_9CILI|nr:unnamed protein product [Blepharisma stoltei]